MADKMLYNNLRMVMDKMIEEIDVGKEECQSVLSFNLMKGQAVPITINAYNIYQLSQIKFIIVCPFLHSPDETDYIEIYRLGHDEDYINILRLISRFVTTLEMIKDWIQKEVPDMIRWGEGVIFDRNGRTKKVPYIPHHSPKDKK